jgi:hypothetical protein
VLQDKFTDWPSCTLSADTVNVAVGAGAGGGGCGGAGTDFLWQAPSNRDADRAKDSPASRRIRAFIDSSFKEAGNSIERYLGKERGRKILAA